MLMADVERLFVGDSERKEEKAELKILQYVMLVALFAAAFYLPRYAARMQVEEVLDYTNTQPSTQNGAKAQADGSAQEESAGTRGEGKGTIVLDSGHGGSDPGMIGVSGVREKTLNLIYAKKLAVLLEQEGYRVVMTRDSDEGLYDEGESNKKAQDMQRRCAIIEAEDPILTVSIHQNSYAQDSSVCGPQVFYYEHSAQGERLAKCIQDSMNTQLAIARPRVQKANATYYILKRSKGVTVIVECGFLTNPQEEALLQKEEYQDQAVRAVCDGILAYLEDTKAAPES